MKVSLAPLYLDYEMTIGDIMLMFAAISGLHYNLENIIVSIVACKDKAYALGCILPYAQFFAMMYASSYSHWFKAYPLAFIVICGLYLTWVTAIFNLNTTSGARFNWRFTEPAAYLVIVYLDYHEIITASRSALFFGCFYAIIMVRYLFLMNNIVNQICSHMGLRFLHVKDKPASDSKKKTAASSPKKKQS